MAVESGAAEQQYSLRWNDFHSSMLSSFRHLRDEEDFVDVTLACDGLSFSAHKVVLSACSPYFRKLLKANPCQHPIVILRDIHNKDMDSLLRFMYHGEVHIGQEQLSDFLKAAQMLQVRGLTDVPTQGTAAPPLSALDTISPVSSWGGSGSAGSGGAERVRGDSRESRGEAREDRRSRRADGSVPSPPKRARSSDLYNAQMKSRTEKLLAHERSPDRLGNGHEMSLLNQALENAQQPHMNNSMGDQEESSSDVDQSDAESDMRSNVPKQEPLDYDDSSIINANGGILDPARTPNFPGSLLNLQGLLPGPSGMHGAQDNFGAHWTGGADTMQSQTMHKNGENRHHAMNQSVDYSKLEDYRSYQPNGASRRAHELMRVRATDPRPCPQCGKIYRSAHTLRTHLEDKHTVCPGYRCPLCGTVAKSRNSLHSHMSRQHRGISTKDLPVLPMPSKFDPEMASKLLAKAGVKISASELRARASPTGPRRNDIKLDAKSGAAMSETSSLAGDDGADDLSITPSHRYDDGMQLSPPHLNSLPTTTITKVPAVRAAAAAKTLEGLALGLKHDDYGVGLRGSALIDTYVQLMHESAYSAISQEQKNALSARLNLGMKPFPDLSPPRTASLPPHSANLAHQHFFRQMQRQYETMSKPDIPRDEPLDLGKSDRRSDSASDIEMTDKSDERGKSERRNSGEEYSEDEKPEES